MGEKTRSELKELEAGTFWAALARSISPHGSRSEKVHTGRVRKQVERPGYVDSTREITPSVTSSQASSNGSEYEVDKIDIGEAEHDASLGNVEELTVGLVSSFLDYALDTCLRQCPDGQKAQAEVQLRERISSAIYNANGDVIRAFDDGGIKLVGRQGSEWVVDHAYLALIEAKRGFKHTRFDNRTGRVTPVLSGRDLGSVFR